MVHPPEGKQVPGAAALNTDPPTHSQGGAQRELASEPAPIVPSLWTQPLNSDSTSGGPGIFVI